jgi:hypothetical protein
MDEQIVAETGAGDHSMRQRHSVPTPKSRRTCVMAALSISALKKRARSIMSPFFARAALWKNWNGVVGWLATTATLCARLGHQLDDWSEYPSGRWFSSRCVRCNARVFVNPREGRRYGRAFQGYCRTGGR